MQFGKVISLPLSAFLCSVRLDRGWPLAFYVPGALSVVWFAAWSFLAYDGPAVHPRISTAEKLFLLANTDAPAAKLSVNPLIQVRRAAYVLDFVSLLA